jgi:hypothetical protein
VNLAVYAVAAALVLTKLLDVLSTIRFIGAPAEESNPLGSRLMRAVGVRTAAWLVFVLACVIIALTTSVALEGPFSVSLAFCISGLIVSVVQACVARANMRGRHDAVTRLVQRLHRGLESLRPGGR